MKTTADAEGKALSAPLTDHMAKLYRIADGALASIERRSQEDPRLTPPIPKEWWDGYRQALDDVCHFARGVGLCE
jgi:hypothetical protein